MRFQDAKQHTKKAKAAERQAQRDERKAVRLAKSNNEWEK
jgi:hypothetical protein